MPVGRTLITGLVLAVVATLAITFGDALGTDLGTNALLGAACGAVVGLVTDRGVGWRLAGFAAGFVLTWLSYGLRAGVLPDTVTGVAIAVFLVFALCAVVAAASLGRIPLWALLVGVAAMAGAYETVYVISPSDFVAESPTAATSVLIMAALGFAATVVFAALGGDDDDEPSPYGGFQGGDNASSSKLEDLLVTKDGS